jgi:hypothetical protein
MAQETFPPLSGIIIDETPAVLARVDTEAKRENVECLHSGEKREEL